MDWIVWVIVIICLAILYLLLSSQRQSGFARILMSNQPDTHYGYGLKDGPHTWASKYNLAEHRRQSPVNIDNRLVNVVKQNRLWLFFTKFEEVPQIMQLRITDHSIEIWPSYSGLPPMVHWKNADTYCVYGLHHIAFRWSSEHTIDHQQYPLEVQSYFNLNQDPVLSQSNYPKTLAISNLFTETPNKNLYLDSICIHLIRIASSWSSTNSLQPIPPFPIAWLCPEFKWGCYQYPGSLTVPPCSETVSWFVNTELFSISPSQLSCFKSLRNSCGSQILTNHRPVQALNDRVIILNEFDKKQGSLKGYQ